MRHWRAAGLGLSLGLLVSGPVLAQQTTKVCTPVTDTTSGVTRQNCQDVGTGNPFPVTGNVTTAPIATTWQASMTLAAATSTSLVDANVTKAPNSAATPASFTVLTVINSGSNAAYVCQFGGTCSATAGGGYIAAGACDTYNINPTSVPTLFSTAGTTLSLRNGPGC